jgi:hypothetical protein
MATNFDYYAFQANTVISSIKTELDFYKQIGESASSLDDKTALVNGGVWSLPSAIPGSVEQYYQYLTSRITSDKQVLPTMTAYDLTGNAYEIKKLNPDEYIKEMDVMVFRKPWGKLKEFHKIMKIKEFVEKLPYKKTIKEDAVDKNKEYLITEICGGLKTKKFNKNKSEIVYDTQKMEIVSVSCVELNKKGLYEIEWD